MSEEDVRAGLHDAVANEPPLDFDPDSLVASARQQATRRRALFAVGVATVVVAVAAVAVPVALGRGPAPVGAPPSTATSTASPIPSTSSSPGYTADELRRHGQRMRLVLQRLVPRVLPKATAIEYGEFGGEAAGDFHDGQDYVNAPVSFTLGDARYSIFVTVWAAGAPEQSPEEVCAASGSDCEKIGDQGGGPVMAKREDLGEQVITTVHHFRADGGAVQVAAYNYDMAGAAPPEYRPSVPVSLEQLTVLATDPELGL
jgi:hypothetical protein